VTNPWLSISAADYEGHMGPGGADQLAPLAAIFGEVYAATRPSSLALLGCATGNGLDAVDSTMTRRIVGVDVNAEYLAIARQRHLGLGEALDLRCADLLTCQLDGATFALIHAALIFEHVPPSALVARIAGWLSPAGICSVVLQLPGGDRPAPDVSPTGFSSLRALSRSMRLVAAEELRRAFAPHGLVENRAWEVPLRGGKAFHVGLFGRRSDILGT
jgi:hypothetical protein